jgi:hypothetical protein
VLYIPQISGHFNACMSHDLNSALMLYWYIRPWLWVLGPQLAVQMAHCWHYLHMAPCVLPVVHCLSVSRVLLTARCHPKDPPLSSYTYFYHTFIVCILPSHCSGEELFGPRWTVCHLTPIGGLACDFPLLGSFTEPSNCCRWDCSQ